MAISLSIQIAPASVRRWRVRQLEERYAANFCLQCFGRMAHRRTITLWPERIEGTIGRVEYLAQGKNGRNYVPLTAGVQVACQRRGQGTGSVSKLCNLAEMKIADFHGGHDHFEGFFAGGTDVLAEH